MDAKLVAFFVYKALNTERGRGYVGTSQQLLDLTYGDANNTPKLEIHIRDVRNNFCRIGNLDHVDAGSASAKWKPNAAKKTINGNIA